MERKKLSTQEIECFEIYVAKNKKASLSLSGPLGIGQQNWHGRIASSQLLRCTKSSSSQLGRFPANEVGICAKKSFQFSKSYLTTLRVIIQYVRAMLLFQGRVKSLAR